MNFAETYFEVKHGDYHVILDGLCLSYNLVLPFAPIKVYSATQADIDALYRALTTHPERGFATRAMAALAARRMIGHGTTHTAALRLGAHAVLDVFHDVVLDAKAGVVLYALRVFGKSRQVQGALPLAALMGPPTAVSIQRLRDAAHALRTGEYDLSAPLAATRAALVDSLGAAARGGVVNIGWQGTRLFWTFKDDVRYIGSATFSEVCAVPAGLRSRLLRGES